jgi:pantoate--beta-alanine ligase
MHTFHTISEYREWRNSVTDVGHVASLGYLHDGHRSLMRRARAENGHVVVTLYLNRLQFAAGEDLDEYPRDPAGDAAICAAEGVNALVLLSDEEMYPSGFGTRVTSSVSAGRFEAAARPGHLDGVATVVTKLFNIVRPDRTYFGLKDYQQVLVVRQLAEDLKMYTEVVPMPTVREDEGLAMSSRNGYLTAVERADAQAVPSAVRSAEPSLFKWSLGEQGP